MPATVRAVRDELDLISMAFSEIEGTLPGPCPGCSRSSSGPVAPPHRLPGSGARAAAVEDDFEGAVPQLGSPLVAFRRQAYGAQQGQ